MRSGRMLGVVSVVVLVSAAACTVTKESSDDARCPVGDGVAGTSSNANAGSSGSSTGGQSGNLPDGSAGDSAGGEAGSGSGSLEGAVPASPGGFAASNLPTDLDLTVEQDLIIDGTTCGPEATVDTDKGEIRCYDSGELQRRPLYAFKAVKQDDGSEVAVFAGKNIEIARTVRVTVEGVRPLVLLAPGNVQVAGVIAAIPDSISHEKANAGGFSSAKGEQVKGGGPGGGSGTSTSAGGGSYCGKGGKGGGATGAPGGASYGSPEIVPLLGGSSGGNGATGGVGGAGGGALQIVAGGSLTITATGAIHVGGGGGGWNGGGGGSGGGILLEGATIQVAGTLAANGGGGGESGTFAESGLDASADDVAAPGGATGSDATDDDGGDGSAAADANGKGGSTKSGGGGGGAGRIRLNSKSGAAKLSGVLSPSAETECVTQGKL